MTDITSRLRDLFGERLTLNEPLSMHTNFRIGGPARWFVEAKTELEIMEAVRLARAADMPYVVLGGGSNVLVADRGCEALVVKVALRSFSIEGMRVIADAGVMSAALARATAHAGLAGFEWAISLPGTIGGAVRGNAGCFGREMKDVVTTVRLLRDGQVVDAPASRLAFGYRMSVFKRTDDVILQATLHLESGNAVDLRKSMAEQLTRRKAEQPMNVGSAGCIFKNYLIVSDKEAARLAPEIPEPMLRARRVSAGWLIEQADVKGKKIGRAQVSPVHGNFIVNLGGAKADEVVQLIAFVKTRVRDRLGIQLQEEIHYLGF